MSDTIDVTNLVESMRQTFVTVAVDYVFSQALTTPGLAWIGLPLVNKLVRALLSWILNTQSKALVMQAFFLNTSIRKASQAKDYVDAVTAKQNLPPDATDADYEKAEQAEISAFNSFVVLGN